MRSHTIELHIEWVPISVTTDGRVERPEFRCARCGGDVDYGHQGWTHAERMIAA